MTQTNINTMDTIVNKLAEGKTIADALKEVYSKRKVQIPCAEVNMDADVTSLGLSMRTTNALLRAKLNTIGDVVAFCRKDKITNIPGMGRTSGVELFETLLNYCWDNMSEDGKENFLINAVELNSENAIA